MASFRFPDSKTLVRSLGFRLLSSAHLSFPSRPYAFIQLN